VLPDQSWIGEVALRALAGLHHAIVAPMPGSRRDVGDLAVANPHCRTRTGVSPGSFIIQCPGRMWRSIGKRMRTAEQRSCTPAFKYVGHLAR
jgi:hypothetical protein